MLTTVNKIAEKAKKTPKLAFTSLLHHVTEGAVLANLKKMSRDTAAGVDGVGRDEAIETASEWLPKALQKIHRMGYVAPPVRRVHIPMPGSNAKRPLGIPNVGDRAIQKTVADLLSQIYEVDFLPCSFGGRKDRGAHHALSTLRESVMTEGVQWVIEADIKNFFGSISHEWMMKMLKLRVADPRVIKLIERWLKAGVMEGGQLQVNDLGTPQGGPISVLLSNVYLHYVLDLWLEYFVKPRVKGSLRVVRYIDDFVILFSRKEDAEAVYAVLGERLGKFGLELEPSKTRLAHFGLRSSLEDRRNGVKAKTIYFLGFTHYIGRSRRGKPMHKFKTEKSRLSRAHSHLKDLVSTHRHKSLREQQKRINQFLTGHFRYYGMSTNFDNLERIYHVAESQWRRALSRRSQLGKVTWIKMNRILKLFPLSKPRIFVDFGKISELASL